MVTSWVVGAPIAQHRLTGKPYLTHRLTTRRSGGIMPRALSGARGVLIGASASALLWGGLIALFS